MLPKDPSLSFGSDGRVITTKGPEVNYTSLFAQRLEHTSRQGRGPSLILGSGGKGWVFSLTVNGSVVSLRQEL